MLQVGGGYLRGLGGMFSMLSQQGKKKKRRQKRFVCSLSIGFHLLSSGSDENVP